MNLHGNNLTIKKMTYQLTDEVFNIVKAFMISNYRKPQHGIVMSRHITKLQDKYRNDRHIRPNTINLYNKVQIDLQVDENISQPHWFWNHIRLGMMQVRKNRLKKQIQKPRRLLATRRLLPSR